MVDDIAKSVEWFGVSLEFLFGLPVSSHNTVAETGAGIDFNFRLAG